MVDVTEAPRRKVNHLLTRVERGELSTGDPSHRVLGLPIRRVIPQDLHSMMDYGGGAAGLLAAFFANTARGKMANMALASASGGVSALTDYKLSVAKVIPIEVHEVIDYVWGISNVVAPFALGYFKKDKAVSFVQIAVGASTILASLFTDYRAYKGVRWGIPRSQQRKEKKSSAR